MPLCCPLLRPFPLLVAGPLSRLRRGGEHAGKKGLSLESLPAGQAGRLQDTEECTEGLRPWGGRHWACRASWARRLWHGRRVQELWLMSRDARAPTLWGSCHLSSPVSEHATLPPRRVHSTCQPSLLAQLSERGGGRGDERLPGLRSQLGRSRALCPGMRDFVSVCSTV